MPSLPRIEKLANGAHEFLLNDEPYLLLAGELNNSSFSSAAYMHEQTEKLLSTNMNTVLGSVSWEQIEPIEGDFQFEELDKCILWARGAGLRVVLLWFGAYKNGMSTYVPRWVKRDPERFPRAIIARDSFFSSRITETISLFGPDLATSDSRAFSALLAHLKSFDGADQTVIMVQVENESGMLGDSRDRSSAANKVFGTPPPDELLSFLRDERDSLHPDLVGNIQLPQGVGKNWEETFGSSKSSDELFMAYHYAKYHDRVASAGKKAYDLPMYANVWLKQDGDLPEPGAGTRGEDTSRANNEDDSKAAGESGSSGDSDDTVKASGGGEPGSYPSGGPVQHMIPIWHRFAPSLSFIGPDIYVDTYTEICEQYGPKSNQALFIPEQRRNEQGALWSWDAFGMGAIGVSPFGIDTITPEESHWRGHYALLRKVAPFLLDARRKGRKVVGFHFDRFEKGQKDPTAVKEVTWGEWKLVISRAFVFGHPSPAYGMIIQLGSDADDRFLLVGEGYQVQFKSTHPKAVLSGLDTFREVDVAQAGSRELVEGRYLNGDETVGAGGAVARMPWSEPDYGGFHICISIPSRTKMAVATPYFIDRVE